jgi:flagellin-specific chaperone FliS
MPPFKAFQVRARSLITNHLVTYSVQQMTNRNSHKGFWELKLSNKLVQSLNSHWQDRVCSEEIKQWLQVYSVNSHNHYLETNLLNPPVLCLQLHKHRMEAYQHNLNKMEDYFLRLKASLSLFSLLDNQLKPN